MIRLRHVIALVGGAVCSAGSHADGFVNVYEIPSNVSINVISNQLMHERLNKTIHHWDNQPEKDRYKPEPKVPLAQPTGQGITALTQGLSGSDAAAGRAAYQQAFNYHEQVIRKFGLPSGDLGVALASSVAGAWMAYNNQPFPDRFYLPLVRQMRQVVSGSGSGLQALSATERTTTYESFAVVGMMLASSQITWQRNPNAAGADALRARMHAQGGETLKRMLQIAPETVGIGPAGVYATAETRR